MNYVVVDRWR